MIYGKYSRDAHRATSSNRGQSQWMRERASGPIEPMRLESRSWLRRLFA